MCLLGIPAFDHKVMAVALTLWLVYSCDNDAASLIFFVMESSGYTPTGRASYHTYEDFSRTKSPFSIAGLCFTFSFPWRFKLTTVAFSIWFDLLNLGLEESFRPLLSGCAFRYLSKP